MQLLDKWRALTAVGRKLEEALYEQVALEVEAGQRSPGLWAKAIADSEGDPDKTTAYYIKLRVQALKDEIEIAERVAKEETKRQNQDREARAKLGPIDELSDRDRLERCLEFLIEHGCQARRTDSGWQITSSNGKNWEVASREELERFCVREYGHFRGVL